MNSHNVIRSVNPATEEVLQTYEMHSAGQIDHALHAADRAFQQWRESPFSLRSDLTHRAASLLREQKAASARHPQCQYSARRVLLMILTPTAAL